MLKALGLSAPALLNALLFEDRSLLVPVVAVDLVALGTALLVFG